MSLQQQQLNISQSTFKYFNIFISAEGKVQLRSSSTTIFITLIRYKSTLITCGCRNKQKTGSLVLMLLKIEVKTHYILFTMPFKEHYTLLVISTLQIRVLPKNTQIMMKYSVFLLDRHERMFLAILLPTCFNKSHGKPLLIFCVGTRLRTYTRHMESTT